mmetsp:Transcript_37072/g.81457  ORF Transcript_37072/g.81457 Transcript_37072/m.81457 type:complete len:254 (+) Transcript_37072:952-1713(+)
MSVLELMMRSKGGSPSSPSSNSALASAEHEVCTRGGAGTVPVAAVAAVVAVPAGEAERALAVTAADMDAARAAKLPAVASAVAATAGAMAVVAIHCASCTTECRSCSSSLRARVALASSCSSMFLSWRASCFSRMICSFNAASRFACSGVGTLDFFVSPASSVSADAAAAAAAALVCVACLSISSLTAQAVSGGKLSTALSIAVSSSLRSLSFRFTRVALGSASNAFSSRAGLPPRCGGRFRTIVEAASGRSR